MPISLVVRPGVDSAFLAWRAPYIKDCRGFALTRRVMRAPGSTPSPETVKKDDGFAVELVSSWVGFANGPKVAAGARKPTTEWPIQKYLWSDFMVGPGDKVSYRVSPMVGEADSLKEDKANASPWTDVVEIGATTKGGISCYFNRGIVASQWLSRLLPEADPGKALQTIIATPGDKTRNFLGGPIRDKLTSVLGDVNSNGGHVFAALFELNDPELIPLLQALGKRAHVVLGNGSVKHKGDDENADARAALRMCDVHNRMTAPRALAHNKFMVICDSHQTPQAVWTGSTNWTMSGLCTQANNAVLVENAALAQDYLEQWKTLVESGDASPPSLLTSNATAREVPGLDGVTLWFTPMHGQLDLEQAGELIRGAKSGILFLMFNPGPRNTLFSDISDLALPGGQNYDPDLYVQGVLNQNPGTAKNPVTLFNRGEKDRRQRGRRPAGRDPWAPRLLAEGTFEAAARLRNGSQQGGRHRPLRRQAHRDDGFAQHGAQGERGERREPHHHRGRRRSREPIRRQDHGGLQPVSVEAVRSGAARQAGVGWPC